MEEDTETCLHFCVLLPSKGGCSPALPAAPCSELCLGQGDHGSQQLLLGLLLWISRVVFELKTRVAGLLGRCMHFDDPVQGKLLLPAYC